jgi:ribosome-associated heat shock protein Hsp15
VTRLMPISPPDKQRLDKWLWFARLVKTRKQAVDLIAAGHVRVNTQRIDAPGRMIGAGDVLTVALERDVRVVRIMGFAPRRRGAAEAQRLFEDLAVSGQQMR